MESHQTSIMDDTGWPANWIVGHDVAPNAAGPFAAETNTLHVPDGETGL